MDDAGSIYLGLYGGEDSEVLRQDSTGDRLFVSYTKRSLVETVEKHFHIDYLRQIDFGPEWPQCFFSIIMSLPRTTNG